MGNGLGMRVCTLEEIEGNVCCGIVSSLGTAGKSKETGGSNAPVISVLQGLADDSNKCERKTGQ